MDGFPDSPTPLARAVLAVLKVARELYVEITRTKLAPLLYLADLDAIESGRTRFSGAAWRWDGHGPYDHALILAEEWTVKSDLAERRDSPPAEYGSRALSLTVDIDDPLSPSTMDRVRAVIHLHGGRSEADLSDLFRETAPIVEACAAGERGVLLDLNRARRHRQAGALRERFQARREARPPQHDDPGVGDALRSEFLEARDGLRRANTKILGDR
ncbi:hypothetical protein [Streptosporangium pseudovulgare]|uniref:Antitoxin SocA-like Panacea domain-containing protein n=1 Tax=Streptosporangium pseudovulgare TaxID=35765 RepID=A0ABQ2QVY7_9ACTN|nr:hypothetical protein [Streptosporangium pseudovulgare]GGQ00435.1 hypothetical protein GCM10010140_33150 [Streptosporangium pseudovulgare]